MPRLTHVFLCHRPLPNQLQDTNLKATQKHIAAIPKTKIKRRIKCPVFISSSVLKPSNFVSNSLFQQKSHPRRLRHTHRLQGTETKPQWAALPRCALRGRCWPQRNEAENQADAEPAEPARCENDEPLGVCLEGVHPDPLM